MRRLNVPAAIGLALVLGACGAQRAADAATLRGRLALPGSPTIVVDLMPVDDVPDSWVIKRAQTVSDAEAVVALCVAARMLKPAIPIGGVFVFPADGQPGTPNTLDASKALHCPSAH